MSKIDEDKQTLSNELIDFIAMQMDLKMWESFSSVLESVSEYEKVENITDKDILLIKQKIKEYL